MKKSIIEKSLFVLLALAVAYGMLPFAGCHSGSSSSSSSGTSSSGTSSSSSSSSGTSSSSSSSSGNIPTVTKSSRISFGSFRGDNNYIFGHGTNSPDGQLEYITVTEAQGGTATGAVTSYLLDMWKVADGTVTAYLDTIGIDTPETTPLTKAFRMTFTPDGTKVVQAGADRLIIFEVDPVGKKFGNHSVTTAISQGLNTVAPWENHDAKAIDNQYAVLSTQAQIDPSRIALDQSQIPPKFVPGPGVGPLYKTGDYTGTIALVDISDIQNIKQIGLAYDVCTWCHATHAQTNSDETTECGIDLDVTKGADGKFTGKIYGGATIGAHVWYGDIVIDPTVDAASGIPFTLSNLVRVDLAPNDTAKGTTHHVHDVRLDKEAQRLYWSTFVDSTDGFDHIGYVDLTTGKLAADATITPGSAGPAYCGSGMLPTGYMPVVMKTPGYIDVIPKSLIGDKADLDKY